MPKIAAAAPAHTPEALRARRKAKPRATTPPPPPSPAMKAPDALESAAGAASPAPPTKLATLTRLLQRPEGAGLPDLCAATGWQAHSVRGALAGALKRRGLTITSEKVEGGRVYRAAAPQAASA